MFPDNYKELPNETYALKVIWHEHHNYAFGPRFFYYETLEAATHSIKLFSSAPEIARVELLTGSIEWTGQS